MIHRMTPIESWDDSIARFLKEEFSHCKAYDMVSTKETTVVHNNIQVAAMEVKVMYQVEDEEVAGEFREDIVTYVFHRNSSKVSEILSWYS